MDRKFLIILFATVFYNGVTQSSPVGEQISVARLSEEKPPTVRPPTAEHINKKIEVTSVPPVKPPGSHDVTQPPLPAHAEVPLVKNATVNSSSENPHIVNGKNETHEAANNKNTTQIIDNKTLNTTTDGKNVGPPTGNKNATQTVDVKNSTLPTASNKTVTPVPIPAGQTTTGSSSTVTAAPTTNASPTSGSTAKSSPVTGTPTTPAPSATTTTSKDSVITGQNTPAPPAQEKHFDGASFVGGIVLTIGLTAIGFIAFKYYKSGKIDMNYRTL